MASYFVACVRWHDADAADSYGELVVESLRPFGGKYLARGAPASVYEGSSAPERLAILEFPSTEAIRRWFDSADYRRALKIRHDSATTLWTVVMEGETAPSQ